MSHHNTILYEVLKIVPRHEFDRLVIELNGNRYVKRFDCWSHFVTCFYAQLKQRDSIRDIETSLEAQIQKLYHLGITPIKRSTFGDANNRIDYRIYERLFYHLLVKCHHLSNQHMKFPNPIFSMDATLVSVCHALIPWATYRTRKGAIKIHVLLSHQNYLPEFLSITDGNVHEIHMARALELKPDSILLIDRGYYDFPWLYSLHQRQITFVIRAKSDLSYSVIGQHDVAPDSVVISDEDIWVPWRAERRPDKYDSYPMPLRLVTIADPETGEALRFLTNNETYKPETIALLYKQRWQIELFFKWIKQHLKIKSFYGTSENAVFSQVWIAMIVYLVLNYIKMQTRYRYSLLNLTRKINEMAFERATLVDLLTKQHITPRDLSPPKHFQLELPMVA